MAGPAASLRRPVARALRQAEITALDILPSPVTIEAGLADSQSGNCSPSYQTPAGLWQKVFHCSKRTLEIFEISAQSN
jgi:hypothetical protein